MFQKNVVCLLSGTSGCCALHLFPLLALKLSEVRLRLTEEEAAEAERGRRAPHMISASVFVRMGLELEDQQYVPSTYIILII